jgi:hypothetical protein
MIGWVDKLRAKELAADTVGSEYVLPTLWSGTNIGDLDLDGLPRPFVMKSNCGSGDAIFLREGDVIDASSLRTRLQQQLRRPYGSLMREWAYSQIEPCILVEPMMINSRGDVPADYKFHVFGGSAKIVELHEGRFRDHRVNHYSIDWSLLPVEVEVPNIATPRTPPPQYAQMRRLAEELATGFEYVRVDLYAYGERIVFGEMTFYPGSGLLQFDPWVWDARYGDHWISGHRQVHTVDVAEAA